MKDADFLALRKHYDEQATIVQSRFRLRFPGPVWDVIDSTALAQRQQADLMYRDVYIVRMGYCGARLEHMIAGQVLRDARYDPVAVLGDEMCEQMDRFQREQMAA
jgi:hypothetical protein